MKDFTNNYFKKLKEKAYLTRRFDNDGQAKAYWSWHASTEYKCNVFEVRDLPWEKDAHDFIACLKEAGVNEFAITDRSTNLMSLLHAFNQEGCSIKGVCEVERQVECWNGLEKKLQGILMSF